MICKLIEQEIPYTGRELASHWAFRSFGLLGDSMVAFAGPCDVGTDRMADLVDVKADAPIWSERMLHFIVEHFGCGLETAILRQRLLICIIQEILNGGFKAQIIRRKGDDLYEGDAKLSVSIAVQSPVSCMIHVGLNIESRGTPVKTMGLNDLGVEPRALAKDVMAGYLDELEGMTEARCKVRGVP